MALLDVSDVFSDPDLIDTITCVRSNSEIGDNGRPDPFAAQEQEFSFVGIFQDPGPADPRINAPEGQHIVGNAILYTQFALTQGSDEDGTDADIVRFKGAEYVVKAVSDWSNWGHGYIVATLVARKLNP